MKKFLKYFLITIFIFLVNITTVSAESAEIVKVELDSKSENVVVNQEVLLDQNTIKSNVNFYDEGDYVIYKLTIKNNDDKDYFIEDIIDNNTNEYLNFEYIYEGLLEAKSEKEVLLKVTYISALPYDSVLTPTNSVTLNTAVSISVKLTDEIPTGDTDNPNTFDKAHIYLIIEVIGVSGLLVIFIKLKKKNMAMLLLLAVLLIPKTAKAKIELKLEFSFSNDMEVKVNFLDKNYKTLITDSYTKIEFVKIASFPDNAVDVSEEKDESIMAWVENDTLYIGSKYKIFFPSDSNSLLSKSNLAEIKFNNRVDTTFVTYMNQMFENDHFLTELDVSSFRTGNVIGMYKMFNDVASIEEIDISNFDTSKTTNLNNIFMNCTNLKKANLDNLDLTNTYYFGLFYGDTNLKELSLRNLILANTTYVNFNEKLTGGFYTYNTIEKLDVSNWDLSTSTSLSGMFEYFKNVTELIGLDTWDTSTITNMNYMFLGYGTNLENVDLDLNSFDTSNVTTMDQTFYGYGQNAKNVNLVINDWNTSNVRNMNQMFSFIGVDSENTYIEIKNFDVSSVTNINNMFANSGSRAKKVKLNAPNISINSVTSTNNLLYNFGYDAEELEIYAPGWDLTGVTQANGMLSYVSGDKTKKYKVNISNWNTSTITNMEEMFSSNYGGTEFFELDVTGWDTSNVENMYAMFYYLAPKADEVVIKGINDWDVSSVTNMASMFYSIGTNHINKFVLDLSNWDVSNVLSFNSMFSQAASSAQVWELGDLSRWVINPSASLNSMFYYAGSSDTATLDLGTLNLSIANISYMFSGCKPIKVTINLYDNPSNYNNVFSNSATNEGSGIIVNYTADVTNIDDIIATKYIDSSNVVKGQLIVS